MSYLRDEYREAFDKIRFSADFEQRVINNLTAEPVFLNRNLGNKKKGLILLPICAMMICIICAISFVKFSLRDMHYNILSREEISKISGIESVEIIELEKSADLFETKNSHLNEKKMIVLDSNMTVSDGDTIFLQGTMEGADICYDIGYIVNGKFSYLQKTVSAKRMDYEAVAEESGNFYWCINNISENAVLFSASVQYASNDLVYRDYGKDAVSVDEFCTIRLENIQGLLETKKIKGIYLYDYDQKITKEFPADIEKIEYSVEKGGKYGIYAVTEEGELISLNNNISIDYDINYDIDETESDEKLATSEIITLSL